MKRLHPNPQFYRGDWSSLDGKWKFAFDDENVGIKEKWYEGLQSQVEILVPFPYETKMSQIHDTGHHEIVWYERDFEITDLEKHPILHFEGVDYEADVYINGQKVGSHRGGYTAFSFDIFEFITIGTNRLTVKATDTINCAQPRGKQRWRDESYGCWYVQMTGIWKSVWMEYVKGSYIQYVKMTPEFDKEEIIMEVETNVPINSNNYFLEAEVRFEDQVIQTLRASVTEGMVGLQGSILKGNDPWSMKAWSPKEPNLYDVILRLYQNSELVDTVNSYFGMRKIEIEGNRILLNNKELYQRLILDQGYWEESDLTPPSIDALEKDIDLVFSMGYNGVRKHQKTEDARFLYLADKKGLLVWTETGSCYTFNDQAVKNFNDEWLAIVKQNYNHPSIITWVPFNESWGIHNIHGNKKQQAFTESIYYLTKTFDSMRPVITNDGWEHTISDIVTLHDYEEFGEVLAVRYQDQNPLISNNIQFNNEFFMFAKGYGYQGQPIIISEFGGIAFSSEEGWGYGGQVKTEEAFFKRFQEIHDAIQGLPYVSGYCYTQLTDVQQEVNGLLTIERQPKVSLERVKEINEKK